MGSSQTSTGQKQEMTNKVMDPMVSPFVNDALGNMQQLYQYGAGAMPYIGPMTAPLDPTLSQAFTGTYERASNNQQGLQNALQTAYQNIQGQRNNNYGTALGQFNSIYDQSLDATNQNALAGLAGLAGTQNAGVYSGLDDLVKKAYSQNAGVYSGLEGFKNERDNPYLQNWLNSKNQDITNLVNSSMSGMGRYGSFGHANELGQKISDYDNPILAQTYENNQNRYLQSLNNLAGIRQADTGLAGSLLNNLAGIRQADTGLAGQLTGAAEGARRGILDDAMRATQGALGTQEALAANQRAWAQMLPGLNEASYDPYSRIGTIGQYMQGRSQDEMNNQINLYNKVQMLPWTMLNPYLAGMSGLSPFFANTGQSATVGSSTQTATQPFGAQQGIGLGMSLLGMLSDRTAKTDIEKVGRDGETGLDLYSYRYKGDPKEYPKVVGPMAQDLEKKYTGSTFEVGGKLAVKPQALGLLGF